MSNVKDNTKDDWDNQPHVTGQDLKDLAAAYERRGEPAEDMILPATRTPEELAEVIAKALHREAWTCIRGDGTGEHYYTCNEPLGICTVEGMINQLVARGRTLDEAKNLVASKMSLYL